MKRIGFIGCGNMASAVIRGLLLHMQAEPEGIIASAKTEKTIKRAEEQFGIRTTLDNREAASSAEILFLAVKPKFMEEVILEIRDVLRPETVVVSLAAGRSIAWMEERFDRKIKLIRTMPNTPALVGEGMTALCPNQSVTEDELAGIKKIFRSFGRAEVVDESLIDVVTAVSGSSPAWIFMLIEAMSDGAVADGMPRDMAVQFAAQTVLGSAKMVLETGMHPGELKDMVCSPGGTTIESVRVLEDKGLRSAVIEASKACVRKAREL